MSKPDDGGAAFPLVAGDQAQVGMSLRDWFAGQALVGLVSDEVTASAARSAYEYADAMLTERAKE